jgi:hypothetical protein
MNFLDESKQEMIDDAKYYWKGSYWEFLTLFSLDERGKWGEKFVYKGLLSSQLDAYWDADNNTDMDDGIYDVWAMLGSAKKRIEVKTAMRGTRLVSWQHENIYASEDVWDKLIFVDLDYNKLYVTILDYKDMVWDDKHPIIMKKPTLRKDSIDAYKVDTSGKSLERTLAAGLTFSHTVGTDLEPLSEFMRKKIIE